MKTAMQHLIEWLEDATVHENQNKDNCIKKAEQLLEAEKEQIIKSYKEGQNNGYCDGCTSIETAEEYYIQTFKSDE